MPPPKRNLCKQDEPNEEDASTENPSQVQKTGLRATTPTNEGDPVMTPEQSLKKPRAKAFDPSCQHNQTKIPVYSDSSLA